MRKTYFPYYRFCPFCGKELRCDVSRGLRPFCPSCGFVQYLNPTVGVAVVVLDGGRILLGRRSREPFKGCWCIPCGHVEWGEDIREAASREFKEETGLDVDILDVLDVHSNFHRPDGLTVGVWFWGRVVGGRPKAGDDLDDVRFFPIDDIRVALAFPTDEKVINRIRKIIKGD